MKCRIPNTATDEHFSVKNSTYSLSKTSPHILSAEERSSAPRNFLRFQVDGSRGKSKLVGKVKAGINNLLDSLAPLENCYRDEYTTLVESSSWWLYKKPKKDTQATYAPAQVRKAKLETFAVDKSATVKATLYKMAQRVVAKNASASNVSYAQTTKHYIHVDMRSLNI
ncbi:hypothetical protein CPC08DRAFT_770241 [Agrocybe pediades]|nr:hypothetical protein CPC08DRAFT_770241 [Agrocybe pediades]